MAFLVTWGRTSNDILHPGLEFSDYLDFCMVWFTKLDKGTKFLGKDENELCSKFFLLPICVKIQLLMSWTYNYVF